MRIPAQLPALLVLAACASSDASRLVQRADAAPREPRYVAPDPHSHGEPNRVRVEHVSLDLRVDHAAKRIAGTATLELDRIDPAAPLVLDSADLEIRSVRGSDGGARQFELGPADALGGVPRLGRALVVRLQPGDAKVAIDYATSPRAEALQWLGPEQTSSGEPFLFTQGQAVFSRTWIPLQDSPGVRVTYDARVRTAPGLTVVMSAEQLGKDQNGAFRFRMPQPIPPYLIALASGELAFEAISDRTGVWAEPGVVEKARWELADTEKMVAAAEELFGPYRWGRYDLLVLPPAFPYGGMENPRLTFATPTILAGDRSLVALVAHELAHSWSGNLVTNATWRDFWLNEGFTVYFEGRIMERIYGQERADMELALEIASLEEEMAELDPIDEVLHVDLAGRHPDDGFSGVPYTKGALFLHRLEELFGRKRFDAFLRGWFDGHAFESVTTGDFLTYLRDNLLDTDADLAARLDVHAWVEEPGLPVDAPRPSSAALARVDAAVAAFAGGTAAADLPADGWVTQQWQRFLRALPPTTSADDLARLDAAFGFTESGNCEILCDWFQLAIRTGYTAADERLERFLMDVGRRKFLKPLYAELAKTPAGLERARAIYASARGRYHAVSANTLDQVLGVGG